MKISAGWFPGLALGLFAQVSAQSDPRHHDHHNHAEHVTAPIGVMGEHLHPAGEWMFTYAYMAMRMEKNLDGNDKVDPAQILADFMVAPTRMDMQMHMFGVMYGASEKLMLMAMLPYKRYAMDHRTRAGMRFSTHAEGFGDLNLSATYGLSQRATEQWLVNLGLSVPTGDISARDDTPAGSDQKLPYPMQLGSGTYDFSPGLTYTARQGLWSWGAQFKATLRAGENDNEYRLGNEYGVSAWGSYRWRPDMNVSLRLDGRTWGRINGADPELNPMMVPTSRSDLRGGERVDLLLGFDWIPAAHGRRGNRLGVEVGRAVHQDLDGPQLGVDYRVSIAWQSVF